MTLPEDTIIVVEEPWPGMQRRLHAGSAFTLGYVILDPNLAPKDVLGRRASELEKAGKIAASVWDRWEKRRKIERPSGHN